MEKWADLTVSILLPLSGANAAQAIKIRDRGGEAS